MSAHNFKFTDGSQVDCFPNPELLGSHASETEHESEPESGSGEERSYEQQWRRSASMKKKSRICLEGVVDGADDEVLSRTKSLTDGDLDELKGCVDLGFGFSYDEIPELCNTLPALELCYSMSHRFLDEKSTKPLSSSSDSASSAVSDSHSPAVANWKISSPGDDPEDVKARLKFWAQAVACTQHPWHVCSSKRQNHGLKKVKRQISGSGENPHWWFSSLIGDLFSYESSVVDTASRSAWIQDANGISWRFSSVSPVTHCSYPNASLKAPVGKEVTYQYKT